jgi:hypothetical protein
VLITRNSLPTTVRIVTISSSISAICESDSSVAGIPSSALLVGAFKNPGARWDLSPRLVNDHDFRSDATGVAIYYGLA